MHNKLSLKIHKITFIIGGALIVFSVFLPGFLTVNTFNISQDIITSVSKDQPLLLIRAALHLVFLNSLRSFPHYCGVFLIAESMILPDKNKYRSLLKAAIVCFITPTVYELVDRINDIHYDFGMPALLLLCLLTFIGHANYNLVSIIKKLLMVMAFITSMQFLDVMPALNHLPFGRGETSRDIKLSANFLNIESTLNSIALTFFLLLFFVGVLLLFLINDENHLRLISELKEQNEHMVMESRMRALENRTYMEVRHLVHDLKSPLTSAQALVGVLKLSAESSNIDKKFLDYFDRIEDSIDRMSNMISEILNENHYSLIRTQEIILSLLSQISISKYAGLVKIENKVPEETLYINKIRIVRALVNLTENSFYAVDPQNGLITVSLYSETAENQQSINIVVSDNGRGMTSDQLASVWERGYSTRDSHGLGLSFVKKVITNSGGTVSISSTPDVGTSVTLTLPKEDSKNEQNC
ncbi:MAG: sensor histidine kinase [Candidatus Fimivivens sp.]